MLLGDGEGRMMFEWRIDQPSSSGLTSGQDSLMSTDTNQSNSLVGGRKSRQSWERWYVVGFYFWVTEICYSSLAWLDYVR